MLQGLLIAAEGPFWWCLLIWLFVLGAAIGSFINVVVYRLPRGLSLLYPPSRCPACETPIRPGDNVPIFGWLLLAGRCRQCGAAISPRYPMVELTMGLTFVALAIAGPLSGGVEHPPSAARAADAAAHPTEFGRYAYQLLLLGALLSAALTEFDGARFSARLIWPPLIVGLLAPLVWPGVRPLAEPLAAIASDRRAAEWRVLLPLADTLAGLAVGAACGLLVGALARWRRGSSVKPAYAPHRAVVALAWIGVFLGWPAVAVLALAALLLDQLVTSLPLRAAGLRGMGPVVYLFPAALVLILGYSGGKPGTRSDFSRNARLSEPIPHSLCSTKPLLSHYRIGLSREPFAELAISPPGVAPGNPEPLTDFGEAQAVARMPKKDLAVAVAQLADGRLKIAARFHEDHRVERRAITGRERPLAARFDRALVELARPQCATFFMRAALAQRPRQHAALDALAPNMKRR